MRNTGHPFTGANKPKYKKNQILFDGKNGDSAVITFSKGYYSIRGQGPGGTGGDNNYWENGGGGGSGAGFDGVIYISEQIEEVLVSAGVAGDKSVAGTNTFIGSLIILEAGQNGKSGAPGSGGTLRFNSEQKVSVISAKVQSNGETGQFSNASSPDDRCRGGYSVLTNDGAGFGTTAETVKATSPGAGGGGMVQWGAVGGVGMYGELKIVYLGRTLPQS